MSSGIAETYARSLFDLASAADAVDVADEGIKALAEAVRGHMDLREVLLDMGVPDEKKRAILGGIFSGEVAPEALAVATVAVQRGHAEQLSAIAERYREIAQSERGVVVAEVVTAIEMSDAMRSQVVEKLKTALGRPVTLRERVDSGILGGIRIKVAGRVLDGSLSSQLSSMRSALSSAAASGGES